MPHATQASPPTRRRQRFSRTVRRCRDCNVVFVRPGDPFVAGPIRRCPAHVATPIRAAFPFGRTLFGHRVIYEDAERFAGEGR